MTIALDRCANYLGRCSDPRASAVLALVDHRLDEAELHCERAETEIIRLRREASG